MKNLGPFSILALVVCFSAVAQPVIWTGRTYVYDGVRNIRSIGADEYLCDSHGCFNTAILAPPGGAATQVYPNDRLLEIWGQKSGVTSSLGGSASAERRRDPPPGGI